MGEHKLKRAGGSRPSGLLGANGRPVPKGPPKADVRLIATKSEVGLASWLVSFGEFMGLSPYRVQTSAIAFVTKVPLGRLVGKGVEVCTVPDGFPIPERLVDASLPPPLPDAAALAAVVEAIAAQPPEPREQAMTLPPPAEEELRVVVLTPEEHAAQFENPEWRNLRVTEECPVKLPDGTTFIGVLGDVAYALRRAC
jgi:hypothetical protein